MMDPIVEQFGNKFRVRVCGVLTNEQGILLARHEGIGEDGQLWLPPGGGVDFGTSTKANLKREFLEETGMNVEVDELLGVNEHLDVPFHALELFFKVIWLDGSLTTGYDPELAPDQQLIKEVRFVTFEELAVIPQKQKHRFLHNISSENGLIKIRSFF